MWDEKQVISSALKARFPGCTVIDEIVMDLHLLCACVRRQESFCRWVSVSDFQEVVSSYSLRGRHVCQEKIRELLDSMPIEV